MKRALLWVGIFSLVFGVGHASTCPFCSEERGPTLIEDWAKADGVMFGTFANPKLGAGGIEDSVTEFIIDELVKPHEALKGLKKVTLPRYVAPNKSKFLVFVDVYKGKLDPYRGIELSAGTQMVKYLVGASAVKELPQNKRLRYYFDYLNTPETEIALDAYREFAKADYADYKEMATTLPAKTLAGWLQDPKTPSFRFGLYASLLGHCGGAEDANLLRKLIDDPAARRGSGIDGLMAGLVMIQPKEGWKHLDEILLDPKQDFNSRFAVFRTARFVKENRPDLVPKEALVKSLASLVEIVDMSDFAIEEFRKWKQWDQTDAVLDLWGRKSHNLGVIKRAIVRFMLQSPTDSAKAFIVEQRRRDAGFVADVDELLKLESR